jgi:glycosyltransferase involved in cell wall biosynthesis
VTPPAQGLRIGVDATSLIGPRSGVGQTTASIVEALVTLDEGVDITLFPISLRRGGWVRHAVTPHSRIRVARSRMPGRVAAAVWSRVEWPPAELFCGPLDVFWGPNFVLPPLVKAAGVITVHDVAFIDVPETCSDAVMKYTETVPRMMQRANRIIVPSRFSAEQVAAWMPDEADRIRVVHPGVRRVFRERGGPLTPPRMDALGIRHPYAAFLGNLELRKNVDALLKAFQQVRAVHPEAQLVLMGSASVGWDAIAARHASLLDTGSVVVPGYLPDEEVAAIVRGARVFVYPSLYEGFGIPPLEAMAAGTPVVAAKTSSLPEALGEHARWVHPDDIDGIASAIGEHFDGDPDASAIEAARQWAAGFTWAASAAKTLEVFGEALDEVRGGEVAAT